MYLDYAAYVNRGGTLDEATFTRCLVRAEKLIDALTHDRLHSESVVRMPVQLATFDLIHEVQASDARGGRAVASESNDGVGVTYVASSAPDVADRARMTSIVRAYLDGETTASGVPLLYAGVDI